MYFDRCYLGHSRPHNGPGVRRPRFCQFNRHGITIITLPKQYVERKYDISYGVHVLKHEINGVRSMF